MSLTEFNSLTSLLPESLSVKLLFQMLFTIALIFLGKRLYTLLFTPLYYSWDDPNMLIETPAEKSKRELKARKKFGTLPPFPNGWYKLICSGELLAGDVKYVRALGKEWAVFRTKEGKPGVVGAYCPHLGADLSQGTVVGENLVCPFHAFHFDTNGTCSKIPYQENVPKGIKCQDIPHFVEINGAVHVWFDVDNREPQWQVPDLFEGDKGPFKFAARTKHRVCTHVQEIHENGSDTAHLPIVHKKTVLGIPVFWHEWGIQWEPHPEIKHMSNFKVNEAVKVGDYYVPLTKFTVYGHHAGPGLVHFRFDTYLGKLYVAHQLLPVEGFEQDSVYQMWCERKVPLWFAKVVMRGWVQQYERDIVIWNQKQFLSAPQIVSNDGPIAQYRRWFKQFYSDKGTKKQFNLADKDLF